MNYSFIAKYIINTADNCKYGKFWNQYGTTGGTATSYTPCDN